MPHRVAAFIIKTLGEIKSPILRLLLISLIVSVVYLSMKLSASGEKSDKTESESLNIVKQDRDFWKAETARERDLKERAERTVDSMQIAERKEDKEDAEYWRNQFTWTQKLRKEIKKAK